MKLFSDNNENKLEELNIRVPYLRNKISSITPGSKTFIYNTDDSLEVINRLSETKLDLNLSLSKTDYINDPNNSLIRPSTQMKLKSNQNKLKGIVKGIVIQNKRRLTTKGSFLPKVNDK